MVSDEKLMANLLKTASEGRGKSEIPLFPLPFNPEGLELREHKFSGFTEILVTGQIRKVVQPLPGTRSVSLNNYHDSRGIWFIPNDKVRLAFAIFSPDFDSSLKPFYDSKMPFGAVLASELSDNPLPPRYMSPGANAVITASNSNGMLSVTLDDFLSYGGYAVAAGH